MKIIEIADEPIELCKLLKLENLADNGGEAKHLIAEGHVRVNGAIETRKRKKIISGDVIEIGQEKFKVRLSGSARRDNNDEER